MDCSSPGSSVYGFSQARILEWVAISFSRESSWPRDRTQVSCIAGRVFTIWTTREAPMARWAVGKSQLLPVGATCWVSIRLGYEGNGALVPTRLAVDTVGRAANIWLVNESLHFAENSQICGKVAAATLSRSPRKALKLWILHIFLTPT